MKTKSKRKLGEILTEDKLISRTQLEECLADQKANGGLLGQILLKKGLVTEAQLIGALSKQLKVPYLPLKSYSINPDVASWLSGDFCREKMLVAFDGDEHKILIALADPLSDGVSEKIESLTKRKPKIFIAKPSDIFEVIDFLYEAASTKESKESSGG